MKLKFIAGVFLAGVLAVGAATTNELSATLQRGLFEEEANHNLDEAIQAYQTVISQYDKDRKLAATAIFRLGECYRKQNKPSEARGCYERVIRDYSEQGVLVEMSQKILRERAGIQNELSRGTPVQREVEEIVIDNRNAELQGNWQIVKGAAVNKFGPDYQFTSVRSASGQSPALTNQPAVATATFRPNIKVAGTYDVEVWFPQGENRAMNAPWLISHDGGEETVFVNQRTNGGKWLKIGSAKFAAGTKGFVRLSSDAAAPAGVGVVVVADAVRFRWVESSMGSTASAKTSDWVNLFNGQDLAGWTGDPNYWSVQDGYITARAGAGAPANLRINLTSKEAVEDFELRLQYRFRQMAGNQNASAGVQYRTSGDSQQPGYLCELTLRGENVGMLTALERPAIAVLTQRAVIRARPSGQDHIEVVSPLEPFSEIAATIKEGDWNECVISAQGNHLVHKINGHVVADVVDENVKKRSLSGLIALQLNTGAKPGVFVQFRNIQLNHAGSVSAVSTEGAAASNEALAHLERMQMETDADYLQWKTLLAKFRGMSQKELRNALPTAYPDARLTKLLNDCAEAEAQLARERLDKTDTHPDVRKAATTVKTINEQIAITIDGILAGLTVRVETLKVRLDEIEKQIDKLKQSGDRGSKTAGIVATTAASTERTPAEEEARDIRQLEAMIKESPDLINARGQATAGTYLHQAAQDGRLLVVEYLLNHGADVHARVTGQNASTPLHLAVESGHKAIVEMLLQHHADVNAKGLKDRTPVWLAANRGFKSIVELLLANGADVNTPDADGATPLHPAVENGFKAIAELLIEHRADVNARLADSSVNRSNSRAGATPLHLAAKTPEVAELLLAHGAEVNSRDGMGNTPLATAVRENITAVALLLKNHADVNATNSYGVTPLHLAATYGRLEAAKLLVANGANLEARDKEGRTPLFHVNGKEIFEFLLNSGANVNALTIYNTTLADTWSTGSPNQLTTECLQILTERGGKRSDVLLRPLYISVSRNPTNFKDSIFYKGTNSFNQFTLLELLAGVNWKMQSRLRFPDFSRVTIQRLDSVTKQLTEVHVDVRAILKADDCTQDVPLQWGDIVDIPESDHPVGQSFIYPDELQPTLRKCLARSVQVIVKGETNKVSLVPSVGSATLENQSRSTALAGFYLQPAIATFIRTSSDLKHIRVQRKDPSTGKMREILVNEEARPNPDLFLRDGDVILVPEKP